MRVLSVDQSLSCTAWCVASKETDGTITVEDFGIIKTNKELTLYQRIIKIRDALISVIKDNGGIDEVVFEQLAFGGYGNASRNLAGLLASVIIGLLDEGLYTEEEIHLIAPKAAKKILTGNGNASKDLMVESLPKDLRSRFTEEGYKKTTGLRDLADSYAISLGYFKKES
jgi:Holliday junction resolvasome RuvABC endonuclease subunit